MIGGALAGCGAGVLEALIDNKDKSEACWDGAAIGSVTGGLGKAGSVIGKKLLGGGGKHVKD